METASNPISSPLLTSKQDTNSLPNPKPPKASFRYLARALSLNHNDDDRKFKIINVKRFHFQKLTEENVGFVRFCDREAAEQFSAKTKTILKKNLFKGLTFLEMISSFFHLHWLQELRHLKNLREFGCHAHSDCDSQTVALYLRKLNKNLERVSLYNDWTDDSQKLKKLSRALGRLHNLKSCGGYRVFHGIETDETYVGFMDLNKCLEKLPRLKSFECNISDYRLKGLLCLIYRGTSVCENVTKLSIDFEYLKTEEEVVEEAETQDEENKNEEEGEEVNRLQESEEDKDGGESRKSDREENNEVFPFFQFQAFPNLTELHIQDKPKYCSYGSFVVEGFKNLRSLKKLSLELTNCSGVHFIFEGLLHLPQLSSFCLDYPYEIDPHLWKYLALFLQQQANLIFLVFSLDLGVQNGLEAFEDFLASLSNKPQLQYLSLQSNYLPFLALSKGFKRMTGSDQLKSVQLEATSRRFTYSQEFSESFDGFYDFLLRNRNTLSELKLDFPLFKQKSLNDGFAKVLSQLTQLKTFSLDISVGSLLLWHNQQWLHANKVRDGQDDQDLWSLSLNNILPQLEKIQDLTLSFDGLAECPSECRKFMTNCFRVLPSLKSLRYLSFSVPPTGLSSTELESINGVLGELKSLLSIKLLNNNIEDDDLKQIEAKVNELQQSQSLQISLSF